MEYKQLVSAIKYIYLKYTNIKKIICKRGNLVWNFIYVAQFYIHLRVCVFFFYEDPTKAIVVLVIPLASCSQSIYHGNFGNCEVMIIGLFYNLNEELKHCRFVK